MSASHHAERARTALDGLIRESEELAALRAVIDVERRTLGTVDDGPTRQETDAEVVHRLAAYRAALADREPQQARSQAIPGTGGGATLTETERAWERELSRRHGRSWAVEIQQADPDGYTVRVRAAGVDADSLSEPIVGFAALYAAALRQADGILNLSPRPARTEVEVDHGLWIPRPDPPTVASRVYSGSRLVAEVRWSDPPVVIRHGGEDG